MIVRKNKMLQAFILKRVAGVIIKKVMEKREIKKLKKYVEEDNELDLQVRAHARALDKYGRTIEELEKDVAILKRDSHPSQEFICCRKCGCKINKTKVKKRR